MKKLILAAGLTENAKQATAADQKDRVLVLIAAALRSAVTFDDTTTITAARACVYGDEFDHARTLLRTVHSAEANEARALLAAMSDMDGAAY